MSINLLDIYSDYLICQNKHATATGLSDMLSGDISHDKITRYLNYEDLGSKDLWRYNKPEIRRHESTIGVVLILDDSIEEKPYTNENEIVDPAKIKAAGTEDEEDDTVDDRILRIVFSQPRWRRNDSHRHQ